MSLTRKNKVCVLNPHEAEQYRQTGEIPPCSQHKHCSLKTAKTLTKTYLYWDGRQRHFEAYWALRGETRAIFYEQAREWKRKLSGGYVTKQLVRGGGVR